MLRPGYNPQDLEPKMSLERKREKEHQENRKKALIDRGSMDVRHWCSCGECRDSGIPLENRCCADLENFGAWKPNKNICVTKSKGFRSTVMNKYVQDMMRNHLIMYSRNSDQKLKLKRKTNTSNRYVAYKSFVTWYCCGTKLGKSNRIIIPACAVHVIRQKWPEESGLYTGFRPSLDILDE